MLVLLGARTGAQTAPVTVRFDAGQARAVLEILRAEKSSTPATSADWDRLFGTEGYKRLEAREAAMKRPFRRDDFRNFARSDKLVAAADALASTLAAWERVNVGAAAGRALAYLPPGTRVEATIYPVIKPQPNSFVFSDPSPAIFLALDPAVTPEKLANTVAHELHHIGQAAACGGSEKEAGSGRQPAPFRAAVKWLSAFGEGVAMLAAAGGPDVSPHAASDPADRARWERDLARSNADLSALDAFFRDLLAGRLAEAKADERGFGFFGVQGPWYTVGYRMAVSIERALGRAALVEALCDVRTLPATYNRAADALRDRGARWSAEVIRALDGSRERRAGGGSLPVAVRSAS